MTERNDALLEQILVSVRVTEEMASDIKELVSRRIDDRIAIARDIGGLQATVAEMSQLLARIAREVGVAVPDREGRLRGVVG
jgi:hypothetical protein